MRHSPTASPSSPDLTDRPPGITGHPAPSGHSRTGDRWRVPRPGSACDLGSCPSASVRVARFGAGPTLDPADPGVVAARIGDHCQRSCETSRGGVADRCDDNGQRCPARSTARVSRPARLSRLPATSGWSAGERGEAREGAVRRCCCCASVSPGQFDLVACPPRAALTGLGRECMLGSGSAHVRRAAVRGRGAW